MGSSISRNIVFIAIEGFLYGIVFGLSIYSYIQTQQWPNLVVAAFSVLVLALFVRAALLSADSSHRA
jgi:hypothetical protein